MNYRGALIQFLLIAGLSAAIGSYTTLVRMEHKVHASKTATDVELGAQNFVDETMAASHALSEIDEQYFYRALPVAEHLTNGSYAVIRYITESDRISYVDTKRRAGFAFYEVMEQRNVSSADPVPLSIPRERYALLDFGKFGKSEVYVKGLDLLTNPLFANALEQPLRETVVVHTLPTSTEIAGITVLRPTENPDVISATLIIAADLFAGIPFAVGIRVKGNVVAKLPVEPLDRTFISNLMIKAGIAKNVGGTITIGQGSSELAVDWAAVSQADLRSVLIYPLTLVFFTVVIYIIFRRSIKRMDKLRREVHNALFLRSVAVPSLVKKHNEQVIRDRAHIT